jgi:predicted kinase
MLCFVDESGDTGLKVGLGSSPLFTVALVLFSDNDDATACDQRITLLRRELAIPANFEFHFSETPKKIKEAFFKSVVPYNFFYLAITINKAALYGEGFKFKNSFYKYTCNLVFENAKAHLENAIVVFDGSGSRQFKQQLQTYLKKKINEGSSSRIKEVKVQDSTSNNLIQLADMVCGAVSQSMKHTKEGSCEYRNMILHREVFCQVWPYALNSKKKEAYEKKRVVVKKKKRKKK